mmetsp:Transcript_97746/g.276500  ORF Transcript_97746/g.276500 Transcript_97746/m.276500 type:complete len:99 (+) Transcript_97746:325-621(+)
MKWACESVDAAIGDRLQGLMVSHTDDVVGQEAVSLIRQTSLILCVGRVELDLRKGLEGNVDSVRLPSDHEPVPPKVHFLLANSAPPKRSVPKRDDVAR